LVPPPTVAKAYKGLTTLARATGERAASSAILAGTIPATAAAGTALAIMPKALNEVGTTNFRVGKRSGKLSLFEYTLLADQERSLLSWS